MILVALAVAGIASAAPPAASRLSILSDRRISPTGAFDIRWLNDDEVAIGESEHGLGTISLSANLLKVIPSPAATRPSFGTLPQHLGVSGDRLADSDLFFMIRWHARRGTASGVVIASYIADFDLDGDRLLIGGLLRDDKHFVREGAFAWLGSLRGGEESLKPVLPFRSLHAIQDCTGFGFGVVRFVDNGAFIVVPGTEPDIYLLGADARLQRTWSTEALGVEAQCPLTPEQRDDLRENFVGRNQWINRRTMIDEVVPTPEGPMVIIRARKNGRTTWEAALLKDDKPQTFALPFTSDSPWSHISADTRGKRTVFLIADRMGKAENTSPRIILAQWSDH